MEIKSKSTEEKVILLQPSLSHTREAERTPVSNLPHAAGASMKAEALLPGKCKAFVL